MIPIFRLLFAVATLCEALTLSAQTVVPPQVIREAQRLTLEEAIQLSLRWNPEIAKLDAVLADKLGRAVEAEVKLNPAFKITTAGAEVDSAAGEVEIEQPLRPSDFGLRRMYAVALRAATNLEQQAEVLRLLNETALIYYRAWAWEQRSTLLEGARAQADDALETIRQQLEAGQSNVSQRHIFEAETARFAAELLGARGERAVAQSELQRSTGLATRELRLVSPSFGTLPTARALAVFAENRSGIRRIALARREAAARSLRVARADAVFPEFAPGAISRFGGGRESEFGVTLAGRLPLWNRNQGEVARAKGALEASDRELASFDRVGLERSIGGRREQLLGLQARVRSFRDKVIPAYRAAYEATLTQFRAGQASSLQLFEVQKSLVEAQEKEFGYAMEALAARTQLEQLVGGRLEEVPVTERESK